MSSSGVCGIKSQYVLPEQTRKINLDHVSEADKANIEDEQPAMKRVKYNNKLKGQNKKRGPTIVHDKSIQLCDSLVNLQDNDDIPNCSRNKCGFLHDIQEYLKIKPKDIGDVCYMFDTAGKCPRGLTCRFGQSHISPAGRNVVNQPKFDEYTSKGPYVKNQLDKEVQFAVRKKTYDFSLSEKLIHTFDMNRKLQKMTHEEQKNFVDKKIFGTITDEDIIKLRTQEKKQIDWSDKLYLGPLTTVGNLPFRRICKQFGADITCGEMALCSELLQGSPQEWALVKRHHTEDLFGVQLCTNNMHMITKCAQMLEKECEIDFMDLNLGCPIESIFKMGSGCGLVLRDKILESCVQNFTDILSIPATVKTRTGAYSDKRIAHELGPKFRKWGVSMMTIHGRSREQRYTKSADWEYIEEVANVCQPMPVFGGGDVLSYEDYKTSRELAPSVAGVMIGRGALIKPWIFTEIKQQKLWDISSKERFDILKTYVHNGLEHWGCDTRGVENTRRFLLEWLSFLYRYIPVGVLERPPQKINERPPFYSGRDDLETLMASPSCADWIKISEMFLGKVPDGFKFLPKHKANSYQ